jgi:hypothetical protein
VPIKTNASNMTTEQYTFAKNRITELLNPEIQPIGLQLAWEVNDLMKQVNEYEDIHHPEKLVEAEALAEWNAYNKTIPSYDVN